MKKIGFLLLTAFICLNLSAQNGRTVISMDKDWRFKVEDRFFYDGVFQILMSHIDWEDFGEKKIIEAARKDFKKLYKQPPVDVLNNVEWKRRVRKVPGVDGKNSPYKGFLTMYWK